MLPVAPGRRPSALTPSQQATLADTLCDTLRGGSKALSVAHCKRLLQHLLRLPLLPAAQLLSLLSEPEPGSDEGLPQAAQELVVEALAGLDDQQQVGRAGQQPWCSCGDASRLYVVAAGG